ncbi:hypothetical protein ES708_25318 [subsurface metagenome]
MILTNEQRMVKALETIAECLVKHTQIAEQSFKEAKELRDYTLGMMKKDLEITKHFPQGKEILKDLDGT